MHASQPGVEGGCFLPQPKVRVITWKKKKKKKKQVTMSTACKAQARHLFKCIIERLVGPQLIKQVALVRKRAEYVYLHVKTRVTLRWRSDRLALSDTDPCKQTLPCIGTGRAATGLLWWNGARSVAAAGSDPALQSPLTF